MSPFPAPDGVRKLNATLRRNAFLPFELGPGESVVVKLSRNLTEQYTNTGTGTTGEGGYFFFMKANTADVKVSVEAFDRRRA